LFVVNQILPYRDKALQFYSVFSSQSLLKRKFLSDQDRRGPQEGDSLEATEFSPPVPSWDSKNAFGGVNTGKCDLIEPF